MKSPQHLHGQRDRAGREKTAAEDRFSQARDFAVLMKCSELVRYNFGDFQTAGVGADIDGGKSGHEGLHALQRLGICSSAKIHDSAAASLYAVLIRSWPFAAVEGVWAVVALRRWVRVRNDRI